MLSKDLKVALCPLEISWDNFDSNISSVENVLASVHPETDLLILPETFTTGFPAGKSKEEVMKIASLSANVIEWLKGESQRRNVAICGSMVVEENEDLFNRAFVIEPSGDVTVADKRHLFSMAGENKTFTCGNDRLLVRYRGWNIAMIVCYDLRFPVWCRNVSNEYDVLIAVANWPEVRVNAWNVLLPARAIENEAYVCGVDCRGVDNNGFSYDGSSHVYDFKGKEIGIKTNDASIIYATLSREKLDAFRKKFPAYLDADRFTLI